MTKAVVIGGRGKVGGYLVPMLVENGYDVICVSRGVTEPFVKNDCWNKVTQVILDRDSSDFEARIAALDADVIVDMICFKNEDMLNLIDVIKGSVKHYLVCGSIWLHGQSGSTPVREDECIEPMEEYGIQKNLLDKTITRLYKESDFPGTCIHPGQIVCPGDVPINPEGFRSLSTFKQLKAGEPVYLPNFGMETMHHVHAYDVAGVFMAAIKTGSPSFGQGFHAVSARAQTLVGYAKEVASWYGKKADIHLIPFDTWKTRYSESDVAETYSHIIHSPNCSPLKTKEILGYEARYTAYEALKECIQSLGEL